MPILNNVEQTHVSQINDHQASYINFTNSEVHRSSVYPQDEDSN